jgi:ABC-type phosphate transport system substrate-binding protein
MSDRSNFRYPALGLAVFAALAVPILAERLPIGAEAARAQSASPPTFAWPESVPDGTTLRIGGSSAMATINQVVSTQFEQTFPGTSVEIDASDSASGLAALQDGQVDLAAISRPLTPAETAQGLVEVPIAREKIAIIVGADNPLSLNLSDEQVAQIFRGEIREWTELGGYAVPIRAIARPVGSEIRQSLNRYTIFQSAESIGGSDSAAAEGDDTAAIVRALGNDGISYAPVNQVAGVDGVKVVAMYDTFPDDPRYPFSQPYSLVYRGEASPAVQAFLGFATASTGQQAIASTNSGIQPAIASGSSGTGSVAAGVGASGSANGAIADSARDLATDASQTGIDTLGNAASTAAARGMATNAAGAADALGNASNRAGNRAANASGNAAGAVGEMAEGTSESVSGAAGATGEIARGVAANGTSAVTGVATGGSDALQGRFNPWWWLALPAAGLALLLGWLFAGGKRNKTKALLPSGDRRDGIDLATSDLAGPPAVNGADSAADAAPNPIGDNAGAAAAIAAGGAAAVGGLMAGGSNGTRKATDVTATWAEGEIEAATSFAGGLASGEGHGASGATDAASNVIGDAVDNASQFVQGAGEGAGNAIDAATSVAGDVAGNVSQFAQDSVAGVGDAAGGAADAATHTTEDLAGNVSQFVRDSVENDGDIASGAGAGVAGAAAAAGIAAAGAANIFDGTSEAVTNEAGTSEAGVPATGEDPSEATQIWLHNDADAAQEAAASTVNAFQGETKAVNSADAELSDSTDIWQWNTPHRAGDAAAEVENPVQDVGDGISHRRVDATEETQIWLGDPIETAKTAVQTEADRAVPWAESVWQDEAGEGDETASGDSPEPPNEQ